MIPAVPLDDPNRTPLIIPAELVARFKLPGLRLKDESYNRTGTIKDRRNVSVVQEALRLKVDKLVLITSGNNGFSLATLAQGSDLKIVCVIDRSVAPEIVAKLRPICHQIIEVNLQHKILRPEEVIAYAREREDEVIWDVTNGYEDGYHDLVAELRSERPDYIIVPIGSGGIYFGVIESLNRLRLPAKVIGVGVQNTMYSYADKLHTPWTPYARALEANQSQGHQIIRLTEDEVRQTYQEFQHVVRCEPSSAVVFAALQKFNFPPTAKIVLVNSGRSMT